MRKHELLAWIRERIATGDWPPGSKLPSSKKLAEHLRMRQGVVDGVMAVLVAREELISRAGGGRWVPGGTPEDVTVELRPRT